MTIDELRLQREIPLNIELYYDHKLWEDSNYSLVHCTLRPCYVKANAVRAVGSTVNDAVERAWALLQRVHNLEKLLGEELPILIRDQTYEYADSANPFQNYHITWRTVADHVRLVIEDITRKDEKGWYIHDEPLREPYWDKKYLTEIKDEAGFKTRDGDNVPAHEPLKEGESLWHWDDIFALAGSAGFFIQKNGKIVKSLGTTLS